MQHVGAFEAFPGAQITGDEAIARAIRRFATSSSSPSRRHALAMMPLIPATHTSPTVYAVAEKVSSAVVSVRFGLEHGFAAVVENHALQQSPICMFLLGRGSRQGGQDYGSIHSEAGS
ncbi:hypothetical protein B0A49_00649 [Cryomyces minteri]|uniref:Uncharacterized protein n=1 Tax=Cryomyces minteri TaxID=331657 RepID=A0A4U0XXZ3_9PEZI|nr:hypothetical protein B0A49_00649 [Cryomyces minteri]